jgi:acyl-CoA thioester hydrolase
VHTHPIDVYYEDTDFSGVVYHANYLRYFERAREHLLGREELVRLWNEESVGFVVYKATLEFKEGARFGDTLEIRTSVELASPYRAVFDQQAWRPGGEKALVRAVIELCCVGEGQSLVMLPDVVRQRLG